MIFAAELEPAGRCVVYACASLSGPEQALHASASDPIAVVADRRPD